MKRAIRVYGASKLSHSQMWIELRKRYPRIHFTARWPFFTGILEDTEEQAKHFWLDDEADIRQADCVIVYADSEAEKLRGALVEAGIAIGLGKKVFVVGEHPDYGTWQFHPLVVRVKSVEAALAVASCP